MNDNSAIHLNSNHNLTIIDNDISNNDEENFKITLKEIKDSEQEKYVEQVINMFEDIFKKKDENIFYNKKMAYLCRQFLHLKQQ